jgi:hypothetical protein
MKLNELKKEFLLFASKYNKEDLNLLLNYLCTLLRKFEVDINLIECLDHNESNFMFILVDKIKFNFQKNISRFRKIIFN